MRTPSGNRGLGMGVRRRVRDIMALNRSGGRKKFPMSLAPESLNLHEQRGFGEGAPLFSGLIAPKEGRRACLSSWDTAAA